VFTLDIP